MLALVGGLQQALSASGESAENHGHAQGRELRSWSGGIARSSLQDLKSKPGIARARDGDPHGIAGTGDGDQPCQRRNSGTV